MRIWLRDLRRKRGFTQEQLAEKVNLKANHYCMVENGQRMANMTLEFAQKLGEVFELTVDQITKLENEWKLQKGK